MTLERWLFGILLLAAFVPLVAKLGGFKVQSRSAGVSIMALWVGLAALMVCSASQTDAAPPDTATNRPREVRTEGYVGSDTCRACHPGQHTTWSGSYHSTMTQVASSESVVGKFTGQRLIDGKLSAKLERSGDQHIVEFAERDKGPVGRFPIVMTTGSHHMQNYWFATPNNSRMLSLLPWTFLIKEQRWIPRRASFLEHSEANNSSLQTLTEENGTWNKVCIKCHTTHGQPRPRFNETGQLQGLDTQVVEFGISCEACHGPGKDHVEANRNPLHRYAKHLSDEADPTIVIPTGLMHEVSSQVCGQCHGISMTLHAEAAKKWQNKGFDYRPGDDIAESSMRFLLQPGCLSTSTVKSKMPANSPSLESWFWRDGMVRVSGREYNGLIESPCFKSSDPNREKMSCMSCHKMHQDPEDSRPRREWANDQLTVETERNQSCTQCHPKFKDKATLTAHTHHSAESDGSQCYNCHMPYTSYGLMKAMRSHTVDSPSVKASLETGRPNACNQCHLDKTLKWTADHLSAWHEIPKPQLSKDEQEIAASVLWLLSGDAGQRALMAWSYGWEPAKQASGDNWQAPYLAQLLEDPYHAIRFMAHRSLRDLPGFADFRYQFMGKKNRRQVAHTDALGVWSKAIASSKANFSHNILFDDKGRLKRSTFDRLLKARNNRRIYLLE